MALVVTDCRRWQGHRPLLILPLNALSQSRLPFVPKIVVSYFGRKQTSLRFNKSGMKIIGRLQRNSFLRIPFELKSGRSVTRFFSEFGSNSKFSDGGQQTDEGHRPPFDLDLGVLLAGFAFESYNTPEKNVGVFETDGHECETTYLSSEFIKSIYDGQLFVNLIKGVHFPGLDLWGTSDPYVVLRIGDCSVRSRTIWANKDPVWNEKLTLNIQTSAGPNMQVAAWDANVVTSPRRLGNTAVSLDTLCDGKQHSLELDLEGMGGGGRLFLEVQYKSFAQIEAEKKQFSFAGLFSGELLTTAYKSVFGESGISVGDFMGDFMSMRNSGIDLSKPANANLDKSNASAEQANQLSQMSKGGVADPELANRTSLKTIVVQEGTSDKPNDGNPLKRTGNADKAGEVEIWDNVAESLQSFGIDNSGILKDKEAWEVGETIKNLGLESQKRAELLYAESGLAVVEGQTEGNQTSSATEINGDMSRKHSDPLLAGKEELEGLVKQTEGIVGAWAIFNKSQGENEGEGQQQPTAKESETAVTTTTPSTEDEKNDSSKQEDVDSETDGIKTTMFSTAESAMEAWALLATTLGGTSFVKSDFEKICFVENKETDTQVALWKDLRRQRLVVAFRGTEQTKWKDVVTDLNLLAAGFNPERVTSGSNLKEEPLVHSGFLKAYDSVKTRLLSLVRASIDSRQQKRRRQVAKTLSRLLSSEAWQNEKDVCIPSPSRLTRSHVVRRQRERVDQQERTGNRRLGKAEIAFWGTVAEITECLLSILLGYEGLNYAGRLFVASRIKPDEDSQWHIYVTGHSLGGALATLFALELSSSKLAKNQNLHVTMYNFGSPRVGNRVFADNYNKIVKDSWRVVNHRDIVPTVPRLMGYCHVAQPIYLTAEKSRVSDLLDDGYDGDVLGEATADVIIDKFVRLSFHQTDFLSLSQTLMSGSVDDWSIMKGEQTILQKLLETEISMLRAMRDGSAVMQHMEDFYYITLLQRVESRLR